MLKGFKNLLKKPFSFQEQNIILNDINFKIREANLEDVEELFKIQKLIFPVFQPWSKQTYIFELTNRKNIYLLVEQRNDIVGIVGLSKRNKNEAHITNIGVIPEFQNNGVGHFLLEILFKMVQENDFKKLTLEVDSKNDNAIRLYKSLEFNEIRVNKNYYDNGHDAIELCKHINKD
ncbi:ribosomal protein S18-alanine N-acetyltransferase [Companilactobacillus sp. DQM5]|uniref:ribosomal protein S18-alanine N-acetyltransferase n=1 Tax=Companilactobacillus sp. DQM5 TaxID=3463359 RepID=UPI0040595CCF